MKSKIVTFGVAAVCLLTYQHSLGELRVVIPNNHDIEITEQEKVDTREAPGKLVSNASEFLLASIQASKGDAWVMDRRNDPVDNFSLMLMVTYPKIGINKYRSVEPKVICDGTYEPFSWQTCRESSDYHLDLPGHAQIGINHTSITAESAQAMLTFVDEANLNTTSGSTIATRDVHHILYSNGLGLYHLIGDTPDDEYFSVTLRPTEDSGVTTYEITEWSCG